MGLPVPEEVLAELDGKLLISSIQSERALPTSGGSGEPTEPEKEREMTAARSEETAASPGGGFGLPIAARSEETAASPGCGFGLPIASRSEASAAGGLPIASRGENAAGAPPAQVGVQSPRQSLWKHKMPPVGMLTVMCNTKSAPSALVEKAHHVQRLP